MVSIVSPSDPASQQPGDRRREGPASNGRERKRGDAGADADADTARAPRFGRRRAMSDKLLEQVFNLKFTAKQLNRSSVKAEKEEKAERLKVRHSPRKPAPPCPSRRRALPLPRRLASA